MILCHDERDVLRSNFVLTRDRGIDRERGVRFEISDRLVVRQRLQRDRVVWKQVLESITELDRGQSTKRRVSWRDKPTRFVVWDVGVERRIALDRAGRFFRWVRESLVIGSWRARRGVKLIVSYVSSLV